MRIISTLEYQNHEALVGDFLGHPHADKISVKGEERWIKLIVNSNLRENSENGKLDHRVQRLLKISKNDRRQGFIELYFTKDYSNPAANTVICFRNLNDERLVGHFINTRYKNYDFFTWETQTPESYAALGIWTPSKIEIQRLVNYE